MKRIFKAFLILAAGVAALSSCQKSDPLALAISGDKIAINFDGFSPATETVSISADGDWYVYSPEWITVEPSHGTGNASVKVSATKNIDSYSELNAPRQDVIAFCGEGDARYSVNVSQDGESGLDATRHYSKITSTDDFDPSTTYLIIYDLGGDLQASMNVAVGRDDNSYAYGYTTGVKTEDDGSITMNNASLSYKFEAVDGGYAIKQPNGSYLYQSASYANFYSTADVEKASVWTLAIASDGHATLKNISAGDRILQYDNKSYKDYGAWPTVSDGYILPYLYKDAAPPTGEEVSATESTFVASTGTKASIKVSSNRTWKVRNHDSWVKSFTTSGSGDGVIEVELEPNTGSAIRTADFQIIGETTNFHVNLLQAGSFTTISALNEWLEAANTSVDYEANLTNATVSYVNGNNAFIEDATAGILLYKSGHGLSVGDSFTGKITGKGTMYGGAPELTLWDASAASKGTAEAPRTKITLAELLSNFAAYVSRVLVIDEVTVTDGLAQGDRNGRIEQGGKNIALYAKVNNGITMTAGSVGSLLAIPCYNGSTKQLGVWATADFKATLVGGAITMPASLEVENGQTLALGAKANSGAKISYTSSDESVATVDADGNVTGVAIGSATITATAPAVEGYTAAEATCKVSVVAPAPKVTITMAELPSAYGNDVLFEAEGLQFYANQVANYGNGIQFKKGVGYIANADALGKKITKIVINRENSFYPTNYELYAGTAEKPEGTAITASSTSTSSTYDLSKGDYTFFKIINTSNYAGYLDTIVITYAE